MAHGGPLGLPIPGPSLPNGWDGVLQFYRQDAEIGSWLTADVLEELIQISVDTLAEWKAITEFQGFNAKELLKTMRKSFDRYMEEAELSEVIITYDLNGQTKTAHFTNKQPMMVDIAFLINVFSVRGNVWDKIRRKSTKNLKDILDWMRVKYNIDVAQRDPNTPLGPEVVTVPRMAACFPMKICDNFSLGIGKVLCGNFDIGVPVGAVIDSSIFCSFFPAMIPQVSVRATAGVHIVFGLVAVINDSVLHKKDKKFTDLEQILSYYQACYNSAVMPQQTRLKYLRSKGLVDLGTNAFISVLASAIGGAAERIATLRPSDPGLSKVTAAFLSMD